MIPGNDLRPTSIQVNNVTWAQEYFQTVGYLYDSVKAKVQEKTERTYHTVCSLYTFYLDQYCYSEPINELVLAVYPVWNRAAGQLDWQLTVIDSPTIDQSIIPSLSIDWHANDWLL